MNYIFLLSTIMTILMIQMKLNYKRILDYLMKLTIIFTKTKQKLIMKSKTLPKILKRQNKDFKVIKLENNHSILFLNLIIPNLLPDSSQIIIFTLAD